jgi:hypothetical protein
MSFNDGPSGNHEISFKRYPYALMLGGGQFVSIEEMDTSKSLRHRLKSICDSAYVKWLGASLIIG